MQLPGSGGTKVLKEKILPMFVLPDSLNRGTERKSEHTLLASGVSNYFPHTASFLKTNIPPGGAITASWRASCEPR